MPPDVIAFRQARDQCDHFRGEDPYDAKRAADITRQLQRFCTGTDARLAQLRNKYGTEARVLDLLKSYEDRIE